MDIILVRHPKTVANEAHIIYGRTDYPYAEVGFKQYTWVLEKINERYKKLKMTKDIKISIQSSPRERALKLATGIAESIQQQVEVNQQLAEMDFGIFEGLTMEEVMVKYPKAYQDFTFRFEESVIPEGESYSSFSERMDLFCDEIAQLEEKGVVTELIVVSHGGVTRELLERLTGMVPGSSWNMQVDNGCLLALVPENEGYSLRELLNM